MPDLDPKFKDKRRQRLHEEQQERDKRESKDPRDVKARKAERAELKDLRAKGLKLPRTYTVQTGDSLSSIASDLGLSEADFYAALVVPNIEQLQASSGVIHSGDVLKVVNPELYEERPVFDNNTFSDLGLTEIGFESTPSVQPPREDGLPGPDVGGGGTLPAGTMVQDDLQFIQEQQQVQEEFLASVQDAPIGLDVLRDMDLSTFTQEQQLYLFDVIDEAIRQQEIITFEESIRIIKNALSLTNPPPFYDLSDPVFLNNLEGAPGADNISYDGVNLMNIQLSQSTKDTMVKMATGGYGFYAYDEHYAQGVGLGPSSHLEGAYGQPSATTNLNAEINPILHPVVQTWDFIQNNRLHDITDPLVEEHFPGWMQQIYNVSTLPARTIGDLIWEKDVGFHVVNFGLQTMNRIDNLGKTTMLLPQIATAGGPGGWVDPGQFWINLYIDSYQGRPVMTDPVTGELGYYVMKPGEGLVHVPLSEANVPQLISMPEEAIEYTINGPVVKDPDLARYIRAYNVQQLIKSPDGTINWENIFGAAYSGITPDEAGGFFHAIDQNIVNTVGLSGVAFSLYADPAKIDTFVEGVKNDVPMGELVRMLEDPWLEGAFAFATSPMTLLSVGAPQIDDLITKVLLPPLAIAEPVGKFALESMQTVARVTKEGDAALRLWARTYENPGSIREWVTALSKRTHFTAYTSAVNDSLFSLALRYSDEFGTPQDYFQLVLLGDDRVLDFLGPVQKAQMQEAIGLLADADVRKLDELLVKYGPFKDIQEEAQGLVIKEGLSADDPQLIARYIGDAVTDNYARELQLHRTSRGAVSYALSWQARLLKEGWLGLNPRFWAANWLDNTTKAILRGYAPSAWDLNSHQKIVRRFQDIYATAVPDNVVFRTLVDDALDVSSRLGVDLADAKAQEGLGLATGDLPWPIGKPSQYDGFVKQLFGQGLPSGVADFLGGESGIAGFMNNYNFANLLERGAQVSNAIEASARANVFIQAFEDDWFGRAIPEIREQILRNRDVSLTPLVDWVDSGRINNPADIDRFISEVYGETPYSKSVPDSFLSGLIPENTPRVEFTTKLQDKLDAIQAQYPEGLNPLFRQDVEAAFRNANAAADQVMMQSGDAIHNMTKLPEEHLHEAATGLPTSPFADPDTPIAPSFKPRGQATGTKDLQMRIQDNVNEINRTNMDLGLKPIDEFGFSSMADPDYITQQLSKTDLGIPPDNVVYATLFEGLETNAEVAAMGDYLKGLTPDEVHELAMDMYNTEVRAAAGQPPIEVAKMIPGVAPERQIDIGKGNLVQIPDISAADVKVWNKIQAQAIEGLDLSAGGRQAGILFDRTTGRFAVGETHGEALRALFPDHIPQTRMDLPPELVWDAVLPPGGSPDLVEMTIENIDNRPTIIIYNDHLTEMPSEMAQAFIDAGLTDAYQVQVRGWGGIGGENLGNLRQMLGSSDPGALAPSTVNGIGQDLYYELITDLEVPSWTFARHPESKMIIVGIEDVHNIEAMKKFHPESEWVFVRKTEGTKFDISSGMDVRIDAEDDFHQFLNDIGGTSDMTVNGQPLRSPELPAEAPAIQIERQAAEALDPATGEMINVVDTLNQPFGSVRAVWDESEGWKFTLFEHTRREGGFPVKFSQTGTNEIWVEFPRGAETPGHVRAEALRQLTAEYDILPETSLTGGAQGLLSDYTDIPAGATLETEARLTIRPPEEFGMKAPPEGLRVLVSNDDRVFELTEALLNNTLELPANIDSAVALEFVSMLGEFNPVTPSGPLTGDNLARSFMQMFEAHSDRSLYIGHTDFPQTLSEFRPYTDWIESVGALSGTTEPFENVFGEGLFDLGSVEALIDDLSPSPQLDVDTLRIEFKIQDSGAGVKPAMRKLFALKLNGQSASTSPLVILYTPDNRLIWSVKTNMHGPLASYAGSGIGEGIRMIQLPNGQLAIGGDLTEESLVKAAQALQEMGAPPQLPLKVSTAERSWAGSLGEILGIQMKDSELHTSVMQEIFVDQALLDYRTELLTKLGEDYGTIKNSLATWEETSLNRIDQGINSRMLHEQEFNDIKATVGEFKGVVRDQLERSTAKASVEVNSTFFDYTYRQNWENIIRHYGPFTTWQFRNPLFWAQVLPDKPNLVRGLVHYQHASETQRKQNNLTSRFEGTIGTKLPNGGYAAVDPSAFISLFTQGQEPFFLADDEFEPAGGVQSWMQKLVTGFGYFGITPWPWVAHGLERIGAIPGGRNKLSFGPHQRALEYLFQARGSLEPGETFFGQSELSEQLTDYYINRRIVSMEAEGLITESQRLAATQNPDHDIFKQAKQWVREQGVMTGGLSLFSPFGLKIATPGEFKIRQLSQERSELQNFFLEEDFTQRHPVLTGYSLLFGDDNRLEVERVYKKYDSLMHNMNPWEEDYKELAALRAQELERLFEEGVSPEDLMNEYFTNPLKVGGLDDFGNVMEEEDAFIGTLYRLQTLEPRAGQFVLEDGTIDWDEFEIAHDEFMAQVETTSLAIGAPISHDMYIRWKYRNSTPQKVAYELHKEAISDMWEAYEGLQPGGEHFLDVVHWALDEQMNKDLAAGFTLSEALTLRGRNAAEWAREGVPFELQEILTQSLTDDHNLNRYAMETAEILGLNIQDSAAFLTLRKMLDHDLPGIYGDPDAVDNARSFVYDYYYNLTPPEQRVVREWMELPEGDQLIPEDATDEEILNLAHKLRHALDAEAYMQDLMLIRPDLRFQPFMPVYDPLTEQELTDLEHLRVDWFRFSEAREAGFVGSWTPLMDQYYGDPDSPSALFWAELSNVALTDAAYNDPFLAPILNAAVRRLGEIPDEMYAAAIEHFQNNMSWLVDAERTAIMQEHPEWVILAQQEREAISAGNRTDMEILKGQYYAIPYGVHRARWERENPELYAQLQSYLNEQRSRQVSSVYYLYIFKPYEYEKWYGSLTPDQIDPARAQRLAEDWAQALRDAEAYSLGQGEWTNLMLRFIGPSPAQWQAVTDEARRLFETEKRQVTNALRTYYNLSDEERKSWRDANAIMYMAFQLYWELTPAERSKYWATANRQ